MKKGNKRVKHLFGRALVRVRAKTEKNALVSRSLVKISAK